MIRPTKGSPRMPPPLTATSDPPFGSMSRQVNKMMEHLQKGYFNAFPSDTWKPNVNLYENDTAYIICVDLAGVDKDKIDVVVQDQTVTLKGTRHVPLHNVDECDPQPPHPPERIKVHLMEIDHGSFSRTVELPHDVHRERLHATYRNGMLWIELPKG